MKALLFLPSSVARIMMVLIIMFHDVCWASLLLEGGSIERQLPPSAQSHMPASTHEGFSAFYLVQKKTPDGRRPRRTKSPLSSQGCKDLMDQKQFLFCQCLGIMKRNPFGPLFVTPFGAHSNKVVFPSMIFDDIFAAFLSETTEVLKYLAVLYYTSQYFICWDFVGMTI